MLLGTEDCKVVGVQGCKNTCVFICITAKRTIQFLGSGDIKKDLRDRFSVVLYAD